MQLSEHTSSWNGPKVRLDWLCRRFALARAVTSDQLSLVVDEKGVPKAWVVPRSVNVGSLEQVREVLDDVVETSALSSADAWERVVEGSKKLELTEESYERFLDLVQHPRQPNERLKTLAANREEG